MIISVIVPHYNNPDGLESLLNTIPRHESIEIIVVDDNSSKKPYRSCEHEHIIYAKNNSKGAGSARNVGITLAKGQWLLFADSDDRFVSGAFNIVLSEAIKAEENEDLIFFPPTSFNEESKTIGKRHKNYEHLVVEFLKENSLFNERKLRAHFFVPWSKLIRASLVENKKIYFDDIMYSNDLLFSAKVGVLSESIKSVGESIYIVTESNDSLTKNNSRDAFNSRLNAAIRYNSFLVKHGYKLYTMPLLKYLLWSRIFGVRCFISTLLKALSGDNKLINKNWFVKFISLKSVKIRFKGLLK